VDCVRKGTCLARINVVLFLSSTASIVDYKQLEVQKIMKTKTDSPFENFTKFVGAVVNVPHAEVKRKLEAEKKQKAKRKRTKTSPAPAFQTILPVVRTVPFPRQ
jgi:hypothetical protein